MNMNTLKSIIVGCLLMTSVPATAGFNLNFSDKAVDNAINKISEIIANDTTKVLINHGLTKFGFMGAGIGTTILGASAMKDSVLTDWLKLNCSIKDAFIKPEHIKTTDDVEKFTTRRTTLIGKPAVGALLSAVGYWLIQKNPSAPIAPKI